MTQYVIGCMFDGFDKIIASAIAQGNENRSENTFTHTLLSSCLCFYVKPSVTDLHFSSSFFYPTSFSASVLSLVWLSLSFSLPPSLQQHKIGYCPHQKKKNIGHLFKCQKKRMFTVCWKATSSGSVNYDSYVSGAKTEITWHQYGTVKKTFGQEVGVDERVNKACVCDNGDCCLFPIPCWQSILVSFNHDHNLSLTLKKYFLCLNLTRSYL